MNNIKVRMYATHKNTLLHNDIKKLINVTRHKRIMDVGDRIVKTEYYVIFDNKFITFIRGAVFNYANLDPSYSYPENLTIPQFCKYVNFNVTSIIISSHSAPEN